MRLPASTVALLLLVAPGAAVAAADIELRTTAGDRLYGQVISQDGDVITINHIVWTRGGMLQGPLTIHKDHILEIEAADSLPALYAKHAKAATDSYPAQYALAKWCFERGLADQAFATAKRLYDDDPSDEVTQELIKNFGFVLDHGAWVKEADYAKAHGLVAFEGRLLTPDQIALRKADYKAKAALDEAVSHQHSLDSATTMDQHRLTEATQHLTVLSQEEAAARAALGGGNQGNGNQGNGRRNGGGGQNGNNANNGNPLQLQSQSEADLEGIQLDYEKRKAAQKTVIENDKKELEKATTDAAANKDALEKATTDAAAAHKAWIDCLPKDDPDVKAYAAAQAAQAAGEGGDKKPEAAGKAAPGKAMPKTDGN
jgi:hypothetical protein